MTMFKIPILNRLSFRDYQRYLRMETIESKTLTRFNYSLIFTIVFFIFESFIRIIVLFMPKFLLKGIDIAIEG